MDQQGIPSSIAVIFSAVVAAAIIVMGIIIFAVLSTGNSAGG
ncbi:hypothetical protein ACFLUJ_00500 [Chloroflexota bacterium]